jgi:hypothetical protein
MRIEPSICIYNNRILILIFLIKLLYDNYNMVKVFLIFLFLNKNDKNYLICFNILFLIKRLERIFLNIYKIF